MAHSKGDLICFLDVDDWWSADHISRQVYIFQRREVGLVCGNFWTVNELTGRRKLRFRRPPPTGFVLDALLSNYFVGLLTLMIRRSALDELPYIFNDDYHIIGEFDLVMRLATTTYLEFDAEPTAFYRVHGQNETSKERRLQVDELDHWRSTIAIHEAINQSKNFHLFEESVAYKHGMVERLQGNRVSVVKNANLLSWGRRKFLLLSTLVFPRRFLQWVLAIT